MSATVVVLQLVDTCLSKLDQNKKIVVNFLDLAKAFNFSLNRNFLFKKLKYIVFHRKLSIFANRRTLDNK